MTSERSPAYQPCPVARSVDIIGDRWVLLIVRDAFDGVDVAEVIIATDPNTEGEATATYLERMLRDIPGLTVTRIASGLPMGGDLEFADELTLGRALSGRRAMV